MLGNKNVFVYPNCVIVYEDKVHEDLNPIYIEGGGDISPPATNSYIA